MKISIGFFLDFLFENSRGKIFNLLYCHDSAPSTIGKTEQTTIAELQSQSKFPKKNILSKNITFFCQMFFRGFFNIYSFSSLLFSRYGVSLKTNYDKAFTTKNKNFLWTTVKFYKSLFVFFATETLIKSILFRIILQLFGSKL